MATWPRWPSSNSSIATSMPKAPPIRPALPPKRPQKNNSWHMPLMGLAACSGAFSFVGADPLPDACIPPPWWTYAVPKEAQMLRFILLAIALSHLALPANADTRVPQSRAEISLGFAPLVRQATPAVVNIYAKRVVAERVSPFRNDPFFGNLFRDFGETRPRVQNSLGSGVILSAEGLVVSNYHVVGQATDIRVVLSDRREC